MNVGVWIAIVTIASAIAFFAVMYGWVYHRNKRLGTPGIVSRSRLTCPKCQQTFDYDYIPGASFTAVRLGTSRYMSCPLCHKWSVFPLLDHPLPVTPRGS